MAVIEVADGLCGFTATVAGSYYCAAEAPPGMLASLNGIVVAVVFGAGRGIGTGVGSVVISKYGIRTTYLFSSCLTAATGVIYFIVYHLFLKPIRLERRLQRNSKGLFVSHRSLLTGSSKNHPLINWYLQMVRELAALKIRGLKGTTRIQHKLLINSNDANSYYLVCPVHY